MSGFVRFKVAPELLHQLMQFPADVEIQTIDTELTRAGRLFIFEVYSEQFPEGVHDAEPVASRVEIEWDWDVE